MVGRKEGLFEPSNEEYMCISQAVKLFQAESAAPRKFQRKETSKQVCRMERKVIDTGQGAEQKEATEGGRTLVARSKGSLSHGKK